MFINITRGHYALSHRPPGGATRLQQNHFLFSKEWLMREQSTQIAFFKKAPEVIFYTVLRTNILQRFEIKKLHC